MVGTAADPGNVDTVCSIMLFVLMSCAALSTIPIFPTVALSSAMPMSPMMMPPNMKAVVVPQIVRVRRETRSSVSSGSRPCPRCLPQQQAFVAATSISSTCSHEISDERGTQTKDSDAAGSAPHHEDCNAATGWLATVGYANEGFSLYFLCAPDSQKAANLARDNRVSLAIDDDAPQVMEITGLSMAAHAHVVDDPAKAEKAMQLLFARYPEQKALPGPMPAPQDVRIFRLTPTVISVLDYSKGFGHTDLVTC
jgi:hypothetical protein